MKTFTAQRFRKFARAKLIRKKTISKNKSKSKSRSYSSNKSDTRIQCCMCLKYKSTSEGRHIPGVCLARNAGRGHQVCANCWFTKFGLEGGNHPCPGCQKGMPLNKEPKGRMLSPTVYELS